MLTAAPYVGPMLLVLLVLAAGCFHPNAGPNCWRTLLRDWYDGRISGVYAARCYREAIAHLPQDGPIYSTVWSDLENGLRRARFGIVLPLGWRPCGVP